MEPTLALPLTDALPMGLATLVGGWRTVHTTSSKIKRSTPHQSFSAETGGAIMRFSATALDIPITTTHTITGCIVGVGAASRASALRWGVAGNIVIAWVITFPAAGLNAFFKLAAAALG